LSGIQAPACWFGGWPENGVGHQCATIAQGNCLEVLRGAIPARELAEALAWARATVEVLDRTWKELNP
jgi:hypothetical protein